MQYLPVHCELHGWLLLDREILKPREDHLIPCEGHMITRDTRNAEVIETTEYIPKTSGLTDEEFESL